MLMSNLLHVHKPSDNTLLPLPRVIVAEVKSLRGEERLVQQCLNTFYTKRIDVQSRLTLSPVKIVFLPAPVKQMDMASSSRGV